MKDVIIVGGGLAGLSAAWRLKHHDILLLESDDRIGGRVRSERRGDGFAAVSLRPDQAAD